MAISAEQLNVIISAQTKGLRQELDKAQKRIKGFESKSKKHLKSTSASFDMLASAAKRVGPAIAAALSVQAFRNALDAASEIQNLSNIAGVATDRFQVLALTSQQFGINQEKLADILKDVNDKFGDYVQTGAGPLADFFENIAPQVGITASAFADLSSEEKLGAYINALQRANVSQADMTFYMEAIASDSTALVLAFENNSAAIDRMAKKVGLDRQQLQRDMTDPATDFILNRTRRAASAFDLQGTPALIIGDNVIPGAISQSEILNLIKQVQADKNS